MMTNRFLGGVSPLVFAPADAGGGGAPAGGDAGGAGGGQRDTGGGPASGTPGAAGDQSGATKTDSAAAADGSKATSAATSTIAGASAAPATQPPAAASTAPADDWRQQFAGDDKGQLKQLERLASPKAVWDAYRALQAKVSSGELKPAPTPPGADAKPEEIAAWRKEQGLPETAATYVKDLKLEDGLVLPDADKPFLDSFAEVAHEAGVPQAAFNRFLGWFYNTLDAQNAALGAADSEFHTQSLVELSKEWGNDTKANQRAIGNLMELMPGGMIGGTGEQLLLARLPNGNLVGDDPQILRGLVAIAREQFPAATLVPAGTANPTAWVENRMAELEKMMGDPRSEYNTGPKRFVLQEEWRKLYDDAQKGKGRAA